jgi:hypothetical protein
VLDRSAATTLFDGTRNPELGVFILPRTFQATVVEATTTDLLAPDTVYYAQLHVRDTAGTASASNVAIGRTNPPPNYEIVLLSEGDSPGYSIPGSYVVDTVAPYAGVEHFSYVHVCGMPPTQFATVRRHAPVPHCVEPRPSSVIPSQSSSIPLQTSVEGGRDTHVPKTPATQVRCPMPHESVHAIVRPSSTTPSQSSSTLLHVSVPAGPGMHVCGTPAMQLFTVRTHAPVPHVD